MPGHEISTAEMVSGADREMRMRAKVYPRWGTHGKMTQEQADLEGARMMAVRQRLVAAEGMEQTFTRMMGPGWPLGTLEERARFADVLVVTAKRVTEQYPLP